MNADGTPGNAGRQDGGRPLPGYGPRRGGAMSEQELHDRVDNAVVLLFALVTEAIARGTVALLDQDVELATKVIDDDKAIDDRCRHIAELATEALSAPGLRSEGIEYLVAVLQIVPELERSADLAEHVARRAAQGLGGVLTPRSRGLIQSMSNTAIGMWRTAGTAYAQRSRDAAFELADADDELDRLARELVSSRVVEVVQPQVAVDLALLARFYERLGDHAVNLTRRIDTMAAPRRMAAPPRWSQLRKASARRPPPRSGVGGWWSRLRRLRLVPRDEGFIELFREAAVNARDCAEELAKLISSCVEVEERFERIKTFERRGDELTVELGRRLDASFVTPFDREDIHSLTAKLDDVVDDMFSAASLVQLVRPAGPLPETEEQAGVLVAIADEMVALMDCLPNREGARARLQQIERLERQGDSVFRHGMARLFSGEYDALDVLKWKDTVEALEAAINAVEDVSDVVESILVKGS